VCVVAHQQRSDPTPAALGITPPNNDKLFPIEALDLESRATVRLIRAIDVNWRP
jgi:hypothetical protein